MTEENQLYSRGDVVWKTMTVTRIFFMACVTSATVQVLMSQGMTAARDVAEQVASILTRGKSRRILGVDRKLGMKKLYVPIDGGLSV